MPPLWSNAHDVGAVAARARTPTCVKLCRSACRGSSGPCLRERAPVDRIVRPSWGPRGSAMTTAVRRGLSAIGHLHRQRVGRLGEERGTLRLGAWRQRRLRIPRTSGEGSVQMLHGGLPPAIPMTGPGSLRELLSRDAILASSLELPCKEGGLTEPLLLGQRRSVPWCPHPETSRY